MQLILNVLISSSLYTLIGLSFTIIYYPTRFFHLANAAIITLGAYFTYYFSVILLFPFFLSVAFSIILTIVIGVLCEAIVYRPMRKRNVPNLGYLIASLGLYIILQNCISLFWGDNSKIININDVAVGNKIFGAYITTIQIITIVIASSLFILINIFLGFTSTGKAIRAIASNSELCEIHGISSNKIILISFGLGSALAASAGILSGLNYDMTPTLGFSLLLYGVVAMIIGGVGSTSGLVAGSMLVATAQHLVAYYIDTKWMDAITYIILILFLIWKPLGFSGKRLKKVEV